LDSGKKREEVTNSITKKSYLRKVIAVPTHKRVKGQARVLVDPTMGITQHVVDLLRRPRAAVVRVDPIVGSHQRNERRVGRISVGAPLVPVR